VLQISGFKSAQDAVSKGHTEGSRELTEKDVGGGREVRYPELTSLRIRCSLLFFAP
jgi:hypothetical protein